MPDTAVRAYFVSTGPDSYDPTDHVGGAWSDEDLHVSPVVGLLAHRMELGRRVRSGDEKLLGRLSLDILGRLERGPIELETRVLRAGRTIELVETTATISGRETLRARGWFLSPGETTPVAGTPWVPLADPASAEPYPVADVWPGGYIRSIEVRRLEGLQPGRGAAWLRSTVDLIAGERTSDIARFIALIDTANGIAVRESPESWMFPNLDLTIHFFRMPVGEWVGLDAAVSFGDAGLGLTSTVLHDAHGPVGTAQQALTVRALGQPAAQTV